MSNNGVTDHRSEFKLIISKILGDHQSARYFYYLLQY